MKLMIINRDRLMGMGAALVEALDSIVVRIRGSWNVEHTADDQHGHVHAQSVATGRLVFSDIVSVTLDVDRVDNYDPGLDTAAILRIGDTPGSTTHEITITGLKVPQDENGVVLDGRVLVIENTTQANVIRLTQDDDRSFPRNRFDVPRVSGFAITSSAVDCLLYPATLTVLTYNATKARWIVQSQVNDNYSAHAEISSSQNDYEPNPRWRLMRTMFIAPTAANLSITGLRSTWVPATERKTIVNSGLYRMAIAHASTSSQAANRIFCPGGVRYLLNPRESVEIQRLAGDGWRILEKADQWIDVPFDAGNFTANVGNWTLTSGDQTTFMYQIDGNKMTVAFHFVTTSVSSTPTLLRFPIPAGRVSARSVRAPLAQALDNLTIAPSAFASVAAGGTIIELFHDMLGGAWATSTDQTHVSGVFSFMVRDDCSGISENHTDTAHADASHSDVEHSDVSHSDVSHSDSHGDASHSDAPHSDVVHSDIAHSDVAHSDSAHGDSAHSDAHSDVAHSDVAHEDTSHSDIAHSDGAHSDSHDDVAHVDVPEHIDLGHTDHDDLGHQDHGHDDVTEHQDVSHSDSHSDVAHSDVSHTDNAHGDSHSDVSHSDSHSDAAHSDAAHSDSHSDVAHSDVAHSDTSHVDGGHSDSHSDTAPHSDVSHVDVSHGDTPHGDTTHEDAGFHCDTAHSDI